MEGGLSKQVELKVAPPKKKTGRDACHSLTLLLRDSSHCYYGIAVIATTG